ncbi:UDP-2,4-diacetamido-2,4,6-trideoxy-beta-L-altropyranose hydrolase [Halobacillus sp. B23F22_1]|uniref:UDP-2,4-diacetamido-2,4, 6-trideoxy-beta-L-altropyranose hydrolase n=1 Tax=Halobacillus sp. B23F22_1 TaxID=3459514 RepID=UPI00373FAFCA
MEVVIRTDASVKIGTGHVMRCLTLAQQLSENGAHVSFISRLLKGNLIEFIKDKGFVVFPLSAPHDSHFKKDSDIPYSDWLEVNWKTDYNHTAAVFKNHLHHADWLIVDHYALGEKWEKRMKNHVKKVGVIDDLADRKHDCDLIMDQNIFRNFEKRYDHLVPKQAAKLLGPKYMLIRKEFEKAREQLKHHKGTIQRILVSFGGTDPTNETLKTMRAIKALNREDLTVDVVVGENNQDKQEIKEVCKEITNFYFHCQIDYMAELMLKADLAIGAGGSSTWERCYLGVPAITIETAKNQREILSYLEEKEAVFNLGESDNVSAQRLMQTLRELLQNHYQVKRIAEAAREVAQGIEIGSAARHLLGGSPVFDLRNFELKDLEERELETVLKWRNSDVVRSAMYTDHKITLEEHRKWFEGVKRDASTIIKLLYYKKAPIGLVNFSKIDRSNSKCFWGFYIGEESAPKGSGTVLGLLALEFIFEHEGMHKVCAEVLVSNQRSMQFHKKLGFREEGRFIKHTLKNGQYMDVIPMAHFKDIWPEAKKTLIHSKGGRIDGSHPSSK